MAEPTRKTLMSDNWPAPSPPRGGGGGDSNTRPISVGEKSNAGVPCWYMYGVGRISKIAATKVDAYRLRVAVKTSLSSFLLYHKPNALAFLACFLPRKYSPSRNIAKTANSLLMEHLGSGGWRWRLCFRWIDGGCVFDES